jgi:hypothetical protein
MANKQHLDHKNPSLLIDFIVAHPALKCKVQNAKFKITRPPP